MTFEVIIEKDETGYFVAEVPALPGCFTQGKTVEEAVINIKEAIQGWMDVMNEKIVEKKKFFKRIAVDV